MKHYLIIGNCGVGKTHVMRKLLSNAVNLPKKLGLVYFHEVPLHGFALLGKYVGGTFDGSDRLSMSVAVDFPKLHRYAKGNHITMVAEGDRFMNSTFINLFQPEILLIEGSGAEGREKRGSQQTERQLKSIATRISNIQPHKRFADSDVCYQHLKDTLMGAKDANA